MPKNLNVTLFLCAFCLLAQTSTAVAGEWFVNGTKLTGSQALADTALTSSTTVFNILGSPDLTVECTGNTIGIAGGQIASPDTLLASSITLNKCLPGVNLPGCKLTNEQVNILSVRGLTVPAGTLNSLITLLAQTKTLFAVLPFLGSECGFKEALPLHGSIDLLLDNAIHPATLHRALGFTLTRQLLAAASEVDLTGFSFDLGLLNGQSWAFQ